MYLGIAGACAEQKANATDTSYTLSELSYDSVASVDNEYLVELMTSSTEIILTRLTTNEELTTYAFDDSTLPTFSPSVNSLTTKDRPRGNCFGENGNYLYVVGQPLNGDPPLVRYALLPPYNIGTVSPTETSRSNALGAAQGIDMKSDGSVAYIITSTGVTILNLSTNWDITAVSSTGSATLGGSDDDGDTITGYTGIRFKPDGTKVFVSYKAGGDPKLAEYALSTAWDLSTKSFTSSINIGSNLGLFDASTNATPAGFDWNSDGTKLFVCSIHQDYNDDTATPANRDTKVVLYS